MTDQELKDLIAELSRSTAELRASNAASSAELRESQQKTDRQIERTDRQMEDTLRQIKRTDRQLGQLGNKFGSFTEGMAFPSMEKILRDHFKMDVVALRAKARQNSHSIEIDVIAYDNGARNEVYLVEVKSHLTRESIDQMLKTIERFPTFFGAHRDRTIYGIIAAVDIPDNLRKEVLKKGLYLARIHDDTFKLLTPREFKLTAFGPAGRRNGKPKKRPPRKR